MNLGPLKRYESELKEWIYQYAYENYWSPPLIEKLECEWHGEVFDVADIDHNLHHDVWQDLKTLDILKYIRKYCDKFVILPDVFSQRQTPLTIERNEFDMDRQNIVFINGKIWEVEHKKIERHYVYNHNRHTYIFFDSKTGGSLYITPEGQTPKMQVITVFVNAYIIEDVQGIDKWWDMTDNWFGFEITADDKFAVNHADAKVGIYINAPYMVFDYDKEITDQQEPVIHGLMSQSKDQWIRPKWYNMLENQSFIHNENILFTNTALVIYKDGTYLIENLNIDDTGKHVEKVDKHTIKVFHDPDDSISKIIFFLRPYSQVKWTKPDSLYYMAVEENPYASEYLKKYRKYTNGLLNYMDWNMSRSIEEMIEWGYKYDRDILVTIQNYFPKLIRLNKFDVKVSQYWNDERFYKPKFMITFENKLQAYPLLFIDHKLYMADYRIVKGDDTDTIILDPEQFWKLIGYTPTEYVQPKSINLMRRARGTPEPPYKPPQTFVDPYNDFEWLESNLKTSFNDIRVAFADKKPLNPDEVSYQSGKLFRTPYRKDLVADFFGGDPDTFGGYPFANGYLTTDYVTDKILRRFDGVNIFGLGDADFVISMKDNPTAEEVYNIGDRTTIFDGNNIQLLINRTTKKLDGITRVWFNTPVQEHVIDYYNHGIPSLGNDKTYKVHQTLAFDKYGIECTDQIRVACNHYINFDYVYNYVHDPAMGVSEHPVISLFDMKLIDDRLGYNLEIDPTKVSGDFNIGSYNENAMEDENVRALFNPNEVGETKPVPITLKPLGTLLAEKILTRYWLGLRGNTINTEAFSKEVAPLNGTYVKSDGSKGVIPDKIKDFAADNNYNMCSIATRMIGESIVSKTLADAGVNYIRYSGVVIDSNENYTVELNEVENNILKKNKNALPIRVNSDIDMNRSVVGVPPTVITPDPDKPTGKLQLVDVTSDPETVNGPDTENTVTLQFDYV